MSQMPITCEVDLTNLCQNACTFCYFADYRKRHPVELPQPTYKKLLADLRDCGVETLTFTGGGEPTLCSYFPDAIVEAFNLGFHLGLVTNGVLLEKFYTFSDCFQFIRISLDAATSETYRVVKGADHWDSIMRGVAKIDRTDLGFSFVVCPENRHEVEMAKLLAVACGADYIQFKPRIGEALTPAIEEDRVIHTQRFPVNSSLPCAIASLVGVVGATGDVFYCCQKRGVGMFTLGNVQVEPFSNIWSRRNGTDLRSNCTTCRYMNYVEELKYAKQPRRHRGFL